MEISSEPSIMERMDHDLMRQTARSMVFFRKKRGLTQMEMAQRIGISHRHYQTLESGKGEIKLSLLGAISAQLQVPLAMFVGDPGLDPFASLGIYGRAELLDSFHLSMQICDNHGRVQFENKTFKQNFTTGATEPKACTYAWDYQVEPLPLEQVQERLRFLVTHRPVPAPRFELYKQLGGGQIRVKIDWDYLLNEKGEMIGFVSIINTHPSW